MPHITADDLRVLRGHPMFRYAAVGAGNARRDGEIVAVLGPPSSSGPARTSRSRLSGDRRGAEPCSASRPVGRGRRYRMDTSGASALTSVSMDVSVSEAARMMGVSVARARRLAAEGAGLRSPRRRALVVLAQRAAAR